jgi:alcohol dehydrogenase (NADP+)
MVDSCLSCAACLRGEEQKCSKQVSTYNGKDNGSGRAAVFPPGSATLGGYTTVHVVHQRFAILVPPSYPLQCAGPVMCAGVTMYDPLKRYGAKAGSKVGIVGMGGLGQMGVRLAKAMGCEVTAISRGMAKKDLATKCGADHYVASSDAKAMEQAAGSLDLILNTISNDHDYHSYTKLTNAHGRHIILGLNSALGAALVVDMLVCGSSRVKMSGIGGIQATQEVVDLCAKHDIRPDIKIIGVHEINGVYEDLEKGNDSGLRHVIDLATLNDEAFTKCTAPPPDLSTTSSGMTGWGIMSTALTMLFTGRWI